MSRAVVMGLGITGRAVVSALVRRGHDVVLFDDHPSPTVEEWASAQGLAVTAPSLPELQEALAGADWALPTPGLPDHHDFFDAARSVGATVISEFDLAQFWDRRPSIAVTGTDGKTTVVTLITRMLEASGIRAEAVGNTDRPWVDAIDDSSIEWFVVEASSFRLDHSRRFVPTIAVWLNFGPDHLDAHSSLDAYEAAKASIWSHLDANALAIANADDPIVFRHAQHLDGPRVETWSINGAAIHSVSQGVIEIAGEPLVRIDELARSLPHDQSNALAAAGAALAAGATRAACAQVLRDFNGLAHRVELVLEHEGVRWINDSKATTPHATAAALSGFDSVVLIAGGRNKGLAFDEITAHIDRVRHVVAIGEAAPEINGVFEGRASVTTAVSMSEAVEQAAVAARSGDVVLLSPACASFDWYPNYRERGRDFCSLVRSRFLAEDS